MNNRAEKIIEHIKGPKVLDVGAASADPDPEGNKHWLHKRIHDVFPETVGIDLDGKNVEILRKLGWTNIHEGNAETYQTDTLFDTIVAGELIEHVTSPVNFLENMKRMLAPGGRVIVTTPNPFAFFNVVYAIRHYPQTCSHWEHTVWFCPTTITQLVDRIGYRVTSNELVYDYRESSTPVYRIGKVFMRLFGWMMPKILRCNSFVCVMELAETEKPSP